MKQHKVLITIIAFAIVACISPFLLTTYGAERFNYTTTGQIGDTIGGLTAPVIGILNAVLLYWTLIIQGEQIRQDRLRSDIEKRFDRIKNSIKLLKISIKGDVPGNEITGKHEGMNALTTLSAMISLKPAFNDIFGINLTEWATFLSDTGDIILDAQIILQKNLELDSDYSQKEGLYQNTKLQIMSVIVFYTSINDFTEKYKDSAALKTYNFTAMSEFKKNAIDGLEKIRPTKK